MRDASTAWAGLPSAMSRSGSASSPVIATRPSAPVGTSSTRSSAGFRSGRRSTMRTAARSGSASRAPRRFRAVHEVFDGKELQLDAPRRAPALVNGRDLEKGVETLHPAMEVAQLAKLPVQKIGELLLVHRLDSTMPGTPRRRDLGEHALHFIHF